MNLKQLFNFGKKEKINNEEFQEMNKKEKKQFLSNDFIDRMIRIEQRVFASLGEHLPYRKTNYYKGLTEAEKYHYEKYLKNKGVKTIASVIGFLVLAVIVIIINVQPTGNIIGGSEKAVSLLSISLFLFILIIIILFIVLAISRKSREKRFQSNFKILDEVIKKSPYSEKK